MKTVIFVLAMASTQAHALDMFFSLGSTEQVEGVKIVNLASREFVSRETILMQRISLVQPLSDTVSISYEHTRYSILNAPSIPATYRSLVLTVKLF